MRDSVTQEHGGIEIRPDFVDAVRVFSPADRRAAALAERQLGLIHVDELNALGLDRSAIRRRNQVGLLRRVRPSVYVFAGTPHLTQQSLVGEVLSVGSSAAASHDSAAFLWGLTSEEPPKAHVVVRRWKREHRTSAVVHESLDFVPGDRELKDGIPITTAARTIVDLGATSPWLVESALSRGLRGKRFTLTEVNAFVRRVQRRGRRGVGVIRPFLEFHARKPSGTESVLEDRFLRIVQEGALPMPEPQYEVIDPVYGFVCRADFAYPGHRLLIELDGRAYHSDSPAFQADRSKQNITQTLGWTTLRFTWSDVTERPDYTVGVVRRTLSVLA